MVYAGDSLAYMQFVSMHMLLGVKRRDPYWFEPVYLRVKCDEFALSDFDLQFFRNDHLDPSGLDCTSAYSTGQCTCMGRSLGFGQHANVTCQPWFNPNKDLKGNEARTLWILNSGAHSGGMQQFKKILDTAYATALRLVKGHADIVIFRTTPPGHPDCGNFTRPFSNKKEAMLKAPPGKEGYNWNLHELYDKVLKSLLFDKAQGGRDNLPRLETLRSLRGRGGLVLLDVVPMTILRGDGHRPPRDCLHYRLPGVADYWNHLLISALSN